MQKLTADGVEIPISFGSIETAQLKALGLTVYDNGYLNTAVCKSEISYIDGDKGILRYRGYDIEDLVEHSSYLEVCFLLIFGELPSQEELDAWTTRVMRHTFIHENMIDFLKGFRYDAHPMGILVSAVSAMSSFHPEASSALLGIRVLL
jgi:citrate synthase